MKGVERWKAIRTPLPLELADAVYTCGYARLNYLGVDRGVKLVSCRHTISTLVVVKVLKALVHLCGEFSPCTLSVSTFRGPIVKLGMCYSCDCI